MLEFQVLALTGQSLIASLLACTCSYLLVQSKAGSERVVPHSPRAEAPTSRTSPINSFQFYGLAVQVDSAHQPVRRYGAMVRQIAALGANTVLLSVNGRQALPDLPASGRTKTRASPCGTPWLVKRSMPQPAPASQYVYLPDGISRRTK